MARRSWVFLLLGALVPLLFLLCLATGSVHVPLAQACRALVGAAVEDPAWSIIVREVRLPEAWTALLTGAGLATGGLLMQTLFRNPLAGPDVLGITSGSSLGVALLMLAPGLLSGLFPADATIALAAFLGALAMLSIILFADRRVGDGVTLLIIGLMLGYLCGALISVLQVASNAGALKGYVMWGMGTFTAVTMDRLPWLAVPVLTGIAMAFLMTKPLNALLLGNDYAASLGVRVHRARRRLVLVTGLLAGSITAFCGPIAFLGLTTPHIVRAMLRSSDHARLLPATVLCGAALALLCDLLLRAGPAGNALPLNAITSLLGAPVVMWVLWRGRQWGRTA